MSGWTPESMAAHRARLEIIDKLGWGPSSIAGPDYIVSRIKLEKQKLELQIEELEKLLKREEENVNELARQTYDAYSKMKDARRLSGEVTEKWAAAAQKIHDLANHFGSFPFCMQEPCFAAWVSVQQVREPLKRNVPAPECAHDWQAVGYDSAKAVTGKCYKCGLLKT